MKTAKLSGHTGFDGRMPGFQGNNGIQCMIKKSMFSCHIIFGKR
jgi:hypothetical protein